MFSLLYYLSRWFIKRNLVISRNYARKWLREISNNKKYLPFIISSEHAFKFFENNCQISSNMVIKPTSLEIADINLIISKIKQKILANLEFKDKFSQNIKREIWIVGIGAGRIIDISKYIAFSLKKQLKNEIKNKLKTKVKLCLIPSVLSTTSWLNFGIALRKNNKLYMPGTINADKKVIDYDYIISAPAELTLGGLADILVPITALNDWKLAHEKVHIRYSNKGMKKFRQLIEEIISNTNRLVRFNENSIETIVKYFIDSLALCGASMSSLPLEGSEHFFYYYIDELDERKWIHGQIIAFSIIICLKMQQLINLIVFKETMNVATVDADIQKIKNFFDKIGVYYKMEQIKLDEDTLNQALHKIDDFVIQNNLPFSFWNIFASLNPMKKENLIKNIMEFAKSL
ncbi:MAG: hypothetical protein ACTSRZ_13555 [Promethearchaeota archaeon]